MASTCIYVVTKTLQAKLAIWGSPPFAVNVRRSVINRSLDELRQGPQGNHRGCHFSDILDTLFMIDDIHNK